jgi:hypothetical protein
MKRIVLAILILLSINTSYATEIKNGELIKGQLYGTKKYLGEKRNFHYIYSYGSIIKMNAEYAIVEKIDGLFKRTDKKRFEDISIIGNYIVVLYKSKADKNTNTSSIYMTSYNLSNLSLKKDNHLVKTFSLKKGQQLRADLKNSKNLTQAAIISVISGNKYTAHTLNRDLEITNEFNFNTVRNESNISNVLIDNTGNLFICKRFFTTKKITPVHFQRNIDKNLILKFSTNGNLSEMNVDLGDYTSSELKLNMSDNGELACLGYYTEKWDYTTKGFFNLKMNKEFTTILYSNYTEFTQNFITQKWNDYKDKPAKETKKKPNYYQNKIRAEYTTEDGGMIVLSEQYFSFGSVNSGFSLAIGAGSYASQSGTIQERYDYAKDIILTKIDSKGDVQWMKTIKKKQFSQSLDYQFISFISQLQNNNLQIVYNDHKQNTTEALTSKIKFAPYKYGNSATFLVQVNAETGDLTKKVLFDYSSTKNMISTDMSFSKTSTLNRFIMRHGMLNYSVSKININE